LQAIKPQRRTIAVCQTSAQRTASFAGNVRKNKYPTPTPPKTGISLVGLRFVFTGYAFLNQQDAGESSTVLYWLYVKIGPQKTDVFERF
jgi:hypothetical protein